MPSEASARSEPRQRHAGRADLPRPDQDPSRWCGRLSRAAALIVAALTLAACASAPRTAVAPPRPAGWMAPEIVVAPSAFAGVHGLAVDQRGRLLAGSVVGNALWEVDRQTGAAGILIPAPEGQADDIAIGPNGELAWTNYLTGVVRLRERDDAPQRVLAKDLPGINSLDFDRRNGRLYASQVFLGDALWEVDVAGQKPPRLIAKDLGGFNGFEVGPDGQLYGPLWFRNQVVRINPADGKVTTIAAGFKIPAAANLDGKGNLYVVDTASGELVRVTLATGAKTVVATLAPSIDNLAVAPDGTVYLSNMADNAIQAFDPTTGRVRTLTSGKVAVPAGLKFVGNRLWLADIFALREIDPATGAVRDLQRMHATGTTIEYPFSVGVSQRRVGLASWFTGWVELIDRASGRPVATWHDFKAPYDVLPLDDDTTLVAELGTGSVLRVSGADGKQRGVVASGLGGPVQMALERPGQILVTEAAGRVSRIDLASGARSDVATGLALPEGIATTPWGSAIVAEVGSGRLIEIDLANGNRRTVAEDLPIGLKPGPGLPPPYVPTGVAVGADGTIYFSADRNNAVYRIRPR